MSKHISDYPGISDYPRETIMVRRSCQDGRDFVIMQDSDLIYIEPHQLRALVSVLRIALLENIRNGVYGEEGESELQD